MACFSCYDLHPVCDVPQDVLLFFVEHSDEATINAYFAGIASDDEEVQQRAAKMAVDCWEKSFPL